MVPANIRGNVEVHMIIIQKKQLKKMLMWLKNKFLDKFNSKLIGSSLVSGSLGELLHYCINYNKISVSTTVPWAENLKW